MKLRLVIALLLGLAALGCGGGQGGGADPQAGTATDPASGSRGAPGAPGGDAGGSAGGGSRNAPGAPGAPGGGGTGPAARGAPINLPAFIQLQGLPLTVVMARIKGEIEVACGGSLCVKLVVEQGDDSYHPECFVRTDPPTNEPSVVYTDKPLVIVSGSNPTTGTRCPPDPSTQSTDPTTGSTDPTTGSTDPTTGSTDPTTGATDPTGDTESAPSSS